MSKKRITVICCLFVMQSFMLSGCFLATLQTAKTVGQGRKELVMEAYGSIWPAPSSNEYQEKINKNEETFGDIYWGIEGGGRIGLTDKLDLGLKVAIFPGIEAKYQIKEANEKFPLDAAVAIGAHLVPGRSFRASHIAFIMSKDMSKKISLYGSIKLVYFQGLTKSLAGTIYFGEKYSEYDHLIPTITFGISLPAFIDPLIDIKMRQYVNLETGLIYDKHFQIIYLGIAYNFRI